MLYRFSVLLFACFFGLPLAPLFANVHLKMPAVALQDETWECGIQSANRVLASYDQFHDFGQMRSDIGKYRFEYPFIASYSEEVCETIEKRLGPLGHLIKELVCKPIKRATKISVDLAGINIGHPPTVYVEKFRKYDSAFTLEQNASIERIIQLLDQGIPVIALHLQKTKEWYTDIAGTKVGFSYPMLHYFTVAGYDTQGFHVYDTGSNGYYVLSFEDFRKMYDWAGWNTSSPVHAFLESEGVKKRSILFINRPLSSSKRINITNPNLLMSLHRGCDAPGKSRSSDCTAAIHRHCSYNNQGGGVSQEVGANDLGIACFEKSAFRDIAPADLRTYHDGCDDPQSANCMAATHRFCNTLGATGGLVQEIGVNAFGVACFQGGYFDVSHQELKGYHEGCTPEQSSGPNCLAAAGRYCRQAKGFTGGLIQEVGLGAYGVACFQGEYRGVGIR
jgi:hypothetical protein